MPAINGVQRAEILWIRWYQLAREEMAFRYGLRRIPVDKYKEQFALGATVEAGVRRIYENDAERWESRR